ncbi:MAG: hypothetical protein ACI4TT_00305 [Christensenellales bacterium]
MPKKIKINRSLALTQAVACPCNAVASLHAGANESQTHPKQTITQKNATM